LTHPYDGKIYIFGGLGRRPLHEIETYDTDDGIWSKLDTQPTKTTFLDQANKDMKKRKETPSMSHRRKMSQQAPSQSLVQRISKIHNVGPNRRPSIYANCVSLLTDNMNADILVPEKKLAALKNHVLDKDQMIMSPK
jgi:hypothetical protein